MIDNGQTAASNRADVFCFIIFFCTLIYPNQYYKGAQVPCVSTEIYHAVYESIYTSVKCINQMSLHFRQLKFNLDNRCFYIRATVTLYGRHQMTLTTTLCQ